MRASVAKGQFAAAALESLRRHALGVASEGQLCADQFGTQVPDVRKVLRAVVVGDALSRTGEQAQIVRLAWMGDPERITEKGSGIGQVVNVRSLVTAPDDGTVVLVLH